ncbi:hypothetical protein B0H10DRAFT_2193356 [Mycena sp. CBHHK59/15]|nr:hypothetical protein B0H10DRAFT_2193356 [Mycena sp. CBHHK59/15]
MEKARLEVKICVQDNRRWRGGTVRTEGGKTYSIYGMKQNTTAITPAGATGRGLMKRGSAVERRSTLLRPAGRREFKSTGTQHRRRIIDGLGHGDGNKLKRLPVSQGGERLPPRDPQENEKGKSEEWWPYNTARAARGPTDRSTWDDAPVCNVEWSAAYSMRSAGAVGIRPAKRKQSSHGHDDAAPATASQGK